MLRSPCEVLTRPRLKLRRIRAAYQLCEAISDDWRPTDIEFQAGSLVQLYEVTKAPTEQLSGVINKRG
jgi:hypothetical protein